MRWTGMLLRTALVGVPLIFVGISARCAPYDVDVSPLLDPLLHSMLAHPAVQIHVSGVRLLQDGAPRALPGTEGSVPDLAPDEPFEFRWVTDGVAARVRFRITGPRGMGPGANLSLDIPRGCGVPHSVRVSALPAGHDYTLHLAFDRLPGDQNLGTYDCAAYDPADSVYDHSWPIRFGRVPASKRPLSETTVTQLTLP